MNTKSITSYSINKPQFNNVRLLS